MEDDIQLVQQILAGDKQAYINIINKYNNPLYATILRMTKNHQTAQDLVQEAFIKVYEQLRKYDQKGSFKSWLYKVAINHCLDQLRKKKDILEQVENERMINDATPERVFLKKEKSRELERLVSYLPEDERLILLLRYANDLSYDDICKTLRISLADVRNKLHRAKKKLRIQAQKGGYFHDLSERG